LGYGLLYIFNGALVNQISCTWACQESYKLRHGVYAIGLLDGDEIADRIGWSVGREGNTSFSIPDSDGSYHPVQAVNPNGSRVSANAFQAKVLALITANQQTNQMK
jgi:hypothetical protein